MDPSELNIDPLHRNILPDLALCKASLTEGQQHE